MWNRLIIAFAFSTGSWFSSHNALACSFSPSAFSGLDNYFVYATYAKNRLSEKATMVAVVKTEKVGMIDPDGWKANWYKPAANEPSKVFTMRLHVVKSIQNELDIAALDVPEMNKEEREQAKTRSKRQLDFDLWDGFQIARQSSYWYGQWTSCGLDGDAVALDDQHYLMAKDDDDIFIFEPVAGPEDPLVAGIEDYINGATTSPIILTPKEFFNQIDGYKVFDLMSCPFTTANTMPGEFDEAMYGAVPSMVPEDYEKFDDMFGVVEEINSSSKIKPQNFIFTQKCNVGDRYLLIDKKYNAKYSYSNYSPYSDMPSHRFLKISNGKVDASNIPTNFEFIGSSLLDVVDVKRWIREKQNTK